MKKTILYLIRHAATPANLQHPAKLQGRRSDPELAPIGVRQAEATRDFLAIRPMEFCYSSPLKRAMQTATTISEPHNLKPITIDALTECDVGTWEGLSWEEIKEQYPVEHREYMSDPGKFGYLGGENFAQVQARTAQALEDLLIRHEGSTFMVISHHIVNRIYLATTLGLPVGKARAVSLDNCGVSIVVRSNGKTTIQTLNSIFHLQGVT